MNKKILIVEDNELNMKLFTDLLSAHNYEVIGCDSGCQTMSMVDEHAPDLIIMDIQLPKISGLDLIKQLKTSENFSNIPIIAVTAFATRGDEEKIRNTGCDDYISKPISISHFLETVANIFNKK